MDWELKRLEWIHLVLIQVDQHNPPRGQNDHAFSFESADLVVDIHFKLDVFAGANQLFLKFRLPLRQVLRLVKLWIQHTTVYLKLLLTIKL